MARVRIRPVAGGRVYRVSALKAERLVGRGIFEYVDAATAAPPPPAAPEPEPQPEGDGLNDLTVAELRERAEGLEVEGTGAGGNVLKADLVHALRNTYQRRDLRAEE